MLRVTAYSLVSLPDSCYHLLGTPGDFGVDYKSNQSGHPGERRKRGGGGEEREREGEGKEGKEGGEKGRGRYGIMNTC